MIGIIDIQMGNIRSISYKLQKEGIESVVSSNHKELSACTKLILPGVGHFGKAMENLKQLDLIHFLDDEILVKKKSILGICLGMQLLTRHSEEGNVDGLCWIDAETVKFDFSNMNNGFKIPHVGWNNLNVINENKILNGIHIDKLFYFTHSYRVICKNVTDVCARSDYGILFDSVISHENVTGVQFHPEKSHKSGFALILNFIGN